MARYMLPEAFVRICFNTPEQQRKAIVERNGKQIGAFRCLQGLRLLVQRYVPGNILAGNDNSNGVSANAHAKAVPPNAEGFYQERHAFWEMEADNPVEGWDPVFDVADDDVGHEPVYACKHDGDAEDAYHTAGKECFTALEDN